MSRHTNPGMRGAETQGIVINAKFDWKARDNLKTSSETTMYQATDEAGVWSIRKGEFVYIMKNRSKNIKNVVPSALTNLNGKGAEHRKLFPNDESYQTESLGNDIEVIGIAEDDLFDVKSSAASMFLVKIAGARSILARGPLRFGEYIQAVPPKPAQLSNMKMLEGVPITKVTLIPKPFTANTVSETIEKFMRLFLETPSKRNELFDPRFTRNPLHVAAKAFFTHDLYIVCMGLYKLLSVGAVVWNPTAPPDFDLRATGQNPSPENITIAMMQNFGLFTRQHFSPPGTNVEADMKANYQELAFNILNTIHWDGRTANYGFGFDSTNNTLPGKTKTGQIITSEPNGATLNLQLNMMNVRNSALSQFITHEYSKLKGKMVSNAEEGEYGVMI